MNLNEEELQRNAESGNEPDDMDSKSYQYVFRALKKEPDHNLPPSFADKIIRMVEEKRRGSRDFYWLGMGIFLLLVAFAIAIAMTDFKLNLGFLSGMTPYTGLFAFGIIFIGLLNWIDRRFIKV